MSYKEGESDKRNETDIAKVFFKSVFEKQKNKKHTQMRLVISRARKQSRQRLKCVMSDLSDTPLSLFGSLGRRNSDEMRAPLFHFPPLCSSVAHTAL